MRLTLRTLLAYMDEILEPSDREELAKKVESSEFAHDLIHRTKDTMRRLRLSAPQVIGTGIGLDPNTVAEYLDNVLPPDSVADFERICLESDVHLAEVASAHHVLTMVLGEPAEIDPAARQRMYSLPTEAQPHKQLRVEGAHTVPTPVQDYAAVTPPPHVYPPTHVVPSAPAAMDSVPDYLRASSWTRHGALLAACAAVLLLALGWLLYTGMSGWFGSAQQVALAPGNEVGGDVEPPTQPPLQPPAIPEHAASEPTSTEPSDTPPASASQVTAQKTDTPAPIAAAPRMPLPAMGGPKPPAQTPSVSTPESASATEAPVVSVDESAYGYGEQPGESTDRYADNNAPTVTTPSSNSANVAPGPNDLASSVPAVPAATNVVPPAADAVAAASTTAVVPKADAETPATTPVEAAEEKVVEGPPEPVEIGTYLDGKNILVRFDRQSNSWYRMTPRTAIQPGDRVLALPAFFPKVMLAAGLHLKLVGGTMITFDPEVAGSNEPSIRVNYGKVVIVNTTNGDSALKLTIGDQTADVHLGRNATLAVDVVPKYLPGQDPRKSPSPIVAQLYARDGNVTWTDAAGTNTVSAPGQWKIDGGIATKVSADVTFPDWIDQEPVEQRSEKLFGAPAVEAALDPTRPVEDQLLELYQSSRRREVKSLVARSSVYAGLFVPFVEALRDSDQKAAWKTHIDTLRSAMSLGPDSADKIYQTLVDQRGKAAADDLYQMLCGFGPEQIGTPAEFQNGLGTRLVDWMENDSLDYRVLAVQDMADVTGMRLMSNPAGTPAERARGIRLWRQRLKDGEAPPVSP